MASQSIEELASIISQNTAVVSQHLSKSNLLHLSYGMNEPDLRRLLRHAMAKHIFCKPRDGAVARAAASRLLGEDAQMIAWVGSSTGELWQIAAQATNPSSQLTITPGHL